MNIFNQSSLRKPKKNKFNLSHDKKLSIQMGKLYPTLVQEILPGDTFKVNSEIMLRLAPMISPVMHHINVYTHYFFVPNRILWDSWEQFITGGKDGLQTASAPYFELDSILQPYIKNKALSDYMGIPDLSASTAPIKINSLPFRAYQKIYNEYYRDQTLSTEIPINTGAGGKELSSVFANLLTIRNRSWEKDYFTSAMPWAQRGPEIGLPIVYNDVSNVRQFDGDNPGSASTLNSDSTGKLTTSLPTETQSRIENLDLTESTINNLRKSVRLQEWLEKNARGGARYIEQLLSHFGVAPNDARLQRPEYLGGGKQPVVISEVLQTASDTAGTTLLPLGEMAGHGISVGSSSGFKKSFEEHGFVIGITSVIPRSAYMNGLHKMWQRFDKLEYAWPEFAQLGEQEIKLNELYFTGAALNDSTFGYTPRYSEYKYGQSTVHGEFKTNLDYWHLGRKFAAAPALNESFIQCKTDETKRIFAVTDTDTDDLYCQIYHNIDALRPLPYFGTPTL